MPVKLFVLQRKDGFCDYSDNENYRLLILIMVRECWGNAVFLFTLEIDVCLDNCIALEYGFWII